MSSSAATVLCLACANPTNAGNRRVLGTSESELVTNLWKEIVLNVVKKENKEYDPSGFISRKEKYICKKCFHAYKTFAEKKEVSKVIYKLL